MKVIEIIEEKKTPDGTFAGVRFDEETKKALDEFIKDNDIPNPIDLNKVHSTLLYSKKYLPDYKAAGKLDEPWEGEFKHFSIFGSTPEDGGEASKCLVMEYSCPEQTARFDELMEKHKATYDFDEYKPHVTLSYDVGGLDEKKLPKFKKGLRIVEEYQEDLSLDWKNTET